MTSAVENTDILINQIKVDGYRGDISIELSITNTHELIDLGFDCILTSGQKEKAEEGIENLISWNTKFGSDIIIMPGSGVGVSNCKKFKKAGFKYIHLSAGEDLKPIPIPDGINQNLSFLKQTIRHSDNQTLIEVVKSLKSVE